MSGVNPRYSFHSGDLWSTKYGKTVLRIATMNDDRDLRDRLARAEQNIANQADNFRAFKLDDFQSLKNEVHTMRGELNTKIDELLERVGNINLTMAKWMGAGGVIIFLGQLALNKLF